MNGIRGWFSSLFGGAAQGKNPTRGGANLPSKDPVPAPTRTKYSVPAPRRKNYSVPAPPRTKHSVPAPKSTDHSVPVPSTKRRRLADPALRLMMDLPNGALSHAASYLAPPSQALFAIAMEGRQASEDQTTAVLSQNDWTVLDFSTLEESLTSKLTDDIVEQILMRIDAANHLKVLRLAAPRGQGGGVHVTGRCLAILRGSPHLETIDFSIKSFLTQPSTSFDTTMEAYARLRESGCVNLSHVPLVEGIGPSDACVGFLPAA